MNKAESVVILRRMLQKWGRPRTSGTRVITGATALIACVPIAAIHVLDAQTPAATQARFEVATVKRNVSETPVVGGAGGPAIGVRGGRFTAVNAPVSEIIRHAYALESFQNIEGGPRWLTTDRFDIAALIPEPASGDEIARLMVRNLLADRFKLEVGWTKREQPVYALVVARRDRRPGAGLKPSATDCATVRRQQQENAVKPSAADFLQAQSSRPTCDMAFQPFRARLSAGARSMADFSHFLSRLPVVAAPVIDRTGLTGVFDFELLFAPVRPRTPTVAQADPDGMPSLFTALEEQLGLKLERARGPVEHLVVRRIEPLPLE